MKKKRFDEDSLSLWLEFKMNMFKRKLAVFEQSVFTVIYR